MEAVQNSWSLLINCHGLVCFFFNFQVSESKVHLSVKNELVFFDHWIFTAILRNFVNLLEITCETVRYTSLTNLSKIANYRDMKTDFTKHENIQ